MVLMAKLLRAITNAGALVGGVFLIAGMLLLMGNIFGRFVHFVIPGSYEMFELVMAVPVAFALVYAALESTHVIVNLVVSRFPRKLGAVSEMITSLLSFAIWSLIAWGGFVLAYENGLEEVTDILGFPKLPFRMVWIFCLILFCLTYLVDFSRAFRRLLDR